MHARGTGSARPTCKAVAAIQAVGCVTLRSHCDDWRRCKLHRAARMFASSKGKSETYANVSYAANFPDPYRRTAENFDKNLRGAKPDDLPVEQPIKFDLIINPKNAKALGLTIPRRYSRSRCGISTSGPKRTLKKWRCASYIK